MKSKEELDALKEEIEALNKKLHGLTEEELAQVTGGVSSDDPGGISSDYHGGILMGGGSVITVNNAEFTPNQAIEGGHIFDLNRPAEDEHNK